MRVKQSVLVLSFALACFSLTALAQDISQANITGGGKKGDIPVFTGANSIGNSIAKQAAKNSIEVASEHTGDVTDGTIVFGNNEAD